MVMGVGWQGRQNVMSDDVEQTRRAGRWQGKSRHCAVLLLPLILGGCQDSAQMSASDRQAAQAEISASVEHANDVETAQPVIPNKLLSPSDSLNFGRRSAMYRHLSRQWRVTKINHSAVREGIVLDLRNIETESASLQLSPHCKAIAIDFDMSSAAAGRIAIKEIHRELSACSDEFEDQMMSVLADVIYIEYGTSAQGIDIIELISYQDKIILEPIP